MPRYRFLEIKTPNAQNNERFKKRHSPSLFFDLFTLWTINACFALFNGYLQYFKQITITTISSRKTYAREQYKLPLEVAEQNHSQKSSIKTRQEAVQTATKGRRTQPQLDEFQKNTLQRAVQTATRGSISKPQLEEQQKNTLRGAVQNGTKGRRTNHRWKSSIKHNRKQYKLPLEVADKNQHQRSSRKKHITGSSSNCHQRSQNTTTDRRAILKHLTGSSANCHQRSQNKTTARRAV